MSASYATRRCLLPEDGGCGRELPASEFRRRSAEGKLWGYVDKCHDCRQPIEAAALAEGQRLYESGAPARAVATAIGRAREDATYQAARRYGWSKEKRDAAMAEARRLRDSQCIVKGCYRPRIADNERCDGHARKFARLLDRRATRGSITPRASDAIRIRCHECGMHRITQLAAPVPCPRCGTSGATPVGVFEEVA